MHKNDPAFFWCVWGCILKPLTMVRLLDGHLKPYQRPGQSRGARPESWTLALWFIFPSGNLEVGIQLILPIKSLHVN